MCTPPPSAIPATGRRSLGPAAVVFASALLVRLGVLFYTSDSSAILPTQSDMKFYSDWALRIAGGQWTDHQAFYGLPGYAYFLAATYKAVGYQPFLVSMLQQVIEAGTATLLFAIAGLVFVRFGTEHEPADRRSAQVVGGVAAAGWVFCQSAQAFSMALMPTTYLIGAFWFVVWWTQRRRAGGGHPGLLAFLGLGLLMGVVAMMVANILFLVPFVLAAICLRVDWRPFSWWARGGAAASLIAGLLLGVTPCALHNYLIAHEPVLLSAHSGINFFIGNNDHANGYPLVPAPLHADQEGMLKDSIRWAEADEGRPLKRVEVSAYWSKRAHAFIAEHPGAWLQLLGVKLGNFWRSYPYDDLGLLTELREDGVLLPGLTFGFAAIIGLPGMLLAIWLRPRARWVAAAVLLHMSSLMVVFVTERYRLAAAPGLLLLGSFGIVEVAGAVRSLAGRGAGAGWKPAAAWSTLGVFAGAVALACVVTLRPVDRAIDDHDAYNSALNDIERGHFDVALAKLDRVLADVPDNAETNFAIGNAWMGKNESDKARQSYRRAIQLDPRHYRALNNLSVIAASEKRWAIAEKFLAASLRIEPADAKSQYLLAAVRRELGDRLGARAAVNEALRLEPGREDFRKLSEELDAPATPVNTAANPIDASVIAQ